MNEMASPRTASISLYKTDNTERTERTLTERKERTRTDSTLTERTQTDVPLSYDEKLKLAYPLLHQCLVYFILIVAQFMFSGYHIVATVALNGGTKPIIFSFFRDSFAVPFLFIFTLLCDGIPRIDVAWLPRLAVLGFFGIMANQLFFIIGLNYTTATEGAILQPLIPIWAIIILLVFKMENLYITKYFGIMRLVGTLCAGIGAFAMLGFGLSLTSGNELLGFLCFLGNTLSSAILVVFQKEILKHVPFSRIVFYTYLIGALFLSFTGLYYVDDPSAWVLDKNAWLAVAYASTISSGLVFLCIAWATSHTTPVVVTSFFPFQVLSTSIFAYYFFGVDFTTQDIIGSLLIIAGLFLVTKAQSDIKTYELENDEYSLNVNEEDIIDTNYIKLNETTETGDGIVVNVADESY